MTLSHIQHDVEGAGCSTSYHTPNAALFTEMLTTTCRGGTPLRQALQVARLRQLIAGRAWDDCALALLALLLPEWKLRRLVYDGGEWYCALSRHRDLPEWLDQFVEAHDSNMPLAIIRALLEAMDSPPPSHLNAVAAYEPDDSFEPMLCENFS
jgi:hypothetical protein